MDSMTTVFPTLALYATQHTDAQKPPVQAREGKPEMLSVTEDAFAPPPPPEVKKQAFGMTAIPVSPVEHAARVFAGVEKGPGLSKHGLLDAAKQATADRGLNYGRPEDNFNRIAARWRTHLKNRFALDVPIDGASVAIMMSDMKAARLENDIRHVDSWVDFAGYVACGAEIATGARS